MPNLDPLRFAVELLDIEQSKIDAAWSKVERSFEGRTLKIKIDGEKGAVQDSEGLALSLKEVSENLRSIRRLLSQGGFKTLGDEAQKAAQQMEGLAKSMQQVNDGLSKSEAWQNYVKTLEGAAAAMKQVNDTASKTSSGDGGARAQLTSLAQAVKELEVIQQLERKIGEARSVVGVGGFKDSDLAGYQRRLSEIRNEVGQIAGGQGLHPTLTLPGTDTAMRTSDVLNLKFWGELQKQIQLTLRDVDAFDKDAQKVRQALSTLSGLRGQLTSAIQQNIASKLDWSDLRNLFDAVKTMEGRLQGVSASHGVTMLDASYSKLLNDATSAVNGQAYAMKTLSENTERQKTLLREASSLYERLDTHVVRGFALGTDISHVESVQKALFSLKQLLGGMSNSDLSKSGALDMFDSELKRLTHDGLQAASALEKLNTAAATQTTNRTYVSNYEKATSALYALKKAISEVQDVRERASELKNDTLFRAANAQLVSLSRKYKEVFQLRKDIDKMQSGAALTHVLGADYKKMVGDDTKALSKRMKDLERDASAARKQIGELIAVWRQLQTLTATGRGNEQIRSLQEQIHTMVRSMSNLLRAGNPNLSLQVGSGGSVLLKRATDAMRSYERSERDAAASARQLASDQERAAHAINLTTDASHRQSQVLSDLKQMAFQYLSVWGAQQFLHNIIETGGLLEQQRLSMGAILQDAEKANEIFGQIKALAVKSPFGVVQLDQMSKQLAAYGFEANELYEWTKRLADISAATGTDVSRLALALGHVRSEGALSGYTLRQFSMGNVPLLRSLSESRGVSTKEIRDLVRKKEISDKEVMDVLIRLTDKGGMFFEAQEVMSGALNAKYKNLRDAFDIMYGEIAESGVGDFLKGIATALTDGAKDWKRYGTDILSVVGALAAMKAASYVSSAAMGVHTSATLKAAFASKQQEVANLRLIQSYRELTAAEQYALSSKSRLSASDWSLLLSTKKLTYEDLKRAVALKRISLSEAGRAVELANLRNAQLQLNAAELQGVRVLTTWQRAGFTFRSTLNGMRSAVSGFVRTFWPMLAIGAAVDLFSRHSLQQDEAGEMGDSMASSLLKKHNDLIKLRNSLEESRPQSNEELQTAVKSVTDSLKENGKYTDELRLQVDGTEQLTDKYRMLKMELNAVTDEYARQFETIKMGMSMAMSVTPSNWLHSLVDDTISENFKQLDESRAKMLADVAMTSSRGIDMHTWLRDAAIHGVFSWNEAFDTSRWTEILDQLKKSEMEALSHRLEGIAEQLKKAGANPRNIQDVLDVLNLYNANRSEFDSRLDDIKPEWDEHRSIVLGSLMDKNNIQDLKDLTEEQKRILAEDVHNLKEGLEGRSKWFRDWWESNMLHGLGIRPYVVRESTDELEAWQQSLQSYFDAHGITFRVKSDDTWDTIREGLKKHKDELQKQIDADSPILVRFGLKLDGIPTDIGSFLDGHGVLAPWLRDYFTRGLQRLSASSKEQDAIKEAEKDVPGLVASDKNKNKDRKSEDNEAKRLREEVKLVKDAYEWWKKYRELMSDDAALKEVQERYADFFKEAGVRIDLKDIPNYKASLEAMLAEAEKLYRQKGHHNSYMADVIKELKKSIEQVDYDDLKKHGEDWASALSHEVEMLTRKFEVFQSVVSSTGDEDLAMRVAGADSDDIAAYRTGSRAEVVKRRLMVERPDIDFGKVLELDDEGIDKYVKGLYGASDAVKGVVEQLKKWRDLQRDVVKSDIDNFAKLIGSAVDFQTSIQKIEREYQDSVDGLRRLRDAGSIGEVDYSRGVAMADASRERKSVEALPAYQSLMDGILSVTKATSRDVKRRLVDALQKQLSLGLITAKDYADKLKAINERMLELEKPRGDLYTYMTGGLNGLIQKRMKAGEDMVRDGAQQMQEGQDLISHSFGKDGSFQQLMDGVKSLNGGKDMVSAGEGMQTAAGKMATTVSIIDSIVHGIDNAIQGLKQAYDNITEMLDALGSESAGDPRSWWGQTGTVLSALSASSSQAAGAWDSLKNGDIGGVIGGVVGTITKPVTVFAEAHDARRQAAIDDLLREVGNIDASLDVIRSLGERELGYDRGKVLRELAAMYKAGGALGNQGSAGSAMSAFYGGGVDISGYEHELDQLRKKRQDYIDMYNAEEDKKKSSKEALLEYQERIAELDEQIRYFAEDLARELWSIDIKGWADQIGDALTTAFENGENAAKSYKDVVKSILREVTQKMLSVGIIEPMLGQLQKKLFGYVGSDGNAVSGLYDEKDLDASMLKVQSYLSEYFGHGGEGEKVVTAASQFLTSMERLYNGNGLSLRNDDNGNTLSANVKGMSEETAGLLAGYVNALRQDVSYNRMYLIQIAGTDLPDMKAMMTSGNSCLSSIDSNMKAIVRMMEHGDGALYREIAAINDRLERFAYGHDKITIA